MCDLNNLDKGPEELLRNAPQFGVTFVVPQNRLTRSVSTKVRIAPPLTGPRHRDAAECLSPAPNDDRRARRL
jgi:hypothetical protein